VKALLAAMDAMVSGPAEVLVRVTVCVVGVLSRTAPKLTAVGLTVGAGGAEIVAVAAFDVVDAKFVSPVKAAVIELEPMGRFVTLMAATPLFSVLVPRDVPFLMKEIVLPLVEKLPAL
jgi:hypothetical protein